MLGDPGATFNRTGIGSGWWCTGPPCPSDHNNSAAVGGPFPVDGALLYDVVADPTETTDLAAQHPDVVERLTQLILALNATAVPSGGVCAPPDPGQSPALHNGTCVPWA
jgi:arylsulfatase I/J